ncbi:TUDOR-SN protein 1 [Actinidia rufa]|uniref:TUDOR-SN protein 1 n=1 Tax=Actinidia rufa TaxID=165716 RepID=A0A7J0E142_9ERIC|nr:TUDOR-SN protein 1 [Actinidia rufa]
MIPSLSHSQWNLPPSAIGDSSNFDAMGLLASKEGSSMHATVKQAPSMGRRAPPKTVVIPEISSNELNGEASTKVHAPLTSEQRLEASAGSTTEVTRDPCGRKVKHFTEIRVLNTSSVDKFSNLIGSVYYPDGELVKDLALELIENSYESISQVSGVSKSKSLEEMKNLLPMPGKQKNFFKPVSLAVSAAAGPPDSRVMDLGSVFLASPVKAEGDNASTPALPTRGCQERSKHYDALLSSESRAIAGKKGIHSSKDSPAMHIADLATIEVETVDRTGTFLGSMWESKTNRVVTLLQAGLGKLQTSFDTDRIPDARLLAQYGRTLLKERKFPPVLLLTVGVSHEWPGFSAGVKFDPSDVERLLNVEWKIQNCISVIHGVNLSLLDTAKTW